MRKVIAGVVAGLVLGAGAVQLLTDDDAVAPSPGRLPQAVVSGDLYHDSGEERPKDDKPWPKPTPTPTASPVTP